MRWLSAALGIVHPGIWAGLVAIGATMAVTYHVTVIGRVRTEVQAEMRAQLAEKNAEEYRLRNTANAKVTDEYIKQVRASSAAAGRARADLERVRDELRIQQATATDSGIDDSASAVRELLGECVSLYDESARSAARLADQVRGLQSWTKVCLGE